MIRPILIPARECVCDVCGYRWNSLTEKLAIYCPSRRCRSREWNGKKQISRRLEIKLPAPRRQGRPRISGDDISKHEA